VNLTQQSALPVAIPEGWHVPCFDDLATASNPVVSPDRSRHLPDL